MSASTRSSRGRGCAPARPETAGCRRAGGKLHGYWYAFGDADGYVPGELPDDVAAASTLTKVAASGVFASVSTTKLLTVEEMLAALRGARDVEYRGPGRCQLAPVPGKPA